MKKDFLTVSYQKDEGIGIVTLDNPKRMNAIGSDFIRELNQLLDEISADDGTFAVIIRGSKRVFAVGADIKEISSFKEPRQAYLFVKKAQSVFNRIEDLEKPVIAAVSGLALGGGCELALACDIRIAAENALFGLPEIKLGIIPGGGGTQRLPRLVGPARAKEMLYSGEPIDAHQAERIGLVNRVCSAESLMDEAKAIAKTFAARPGYAIAVLKRLVNEGAEMDIKTALGYELNCFELLFSTEDREEGISAFLEKRHTAFKGK